jgi:hypothetical protein
MIKKIRLPLTLIIASVLLSCSSDKDEDDSRISQEQLNAIVGTWALVEYNVNPPQDVDNDGTASENLVDELDCLSGSLSFTSEFSWSRTAIQVNATPITGGAFGISCGQSNNDSGDWLFLNNQILLEEGAEGTLQLNGNTLTRTLGDDLPGVKELVYEKQ